MENGGQADLAPTTIDDVAAFITDNDVLNDEGPSVEDNPDIEENPEEGSGPDDEEESDDESSEEDSQPEQTSQKFKVTVKGDDGADETVEVDQKELIAGYQRHSRFTQLAQGLAEREEKAVQLVQQAREKDRDHFFQEARVIHEGLLALAGLKSDHELQQLAIQDPSAWVQERQRQELINGTLGQIRAKVQAEMEKQQHERAQTEQRVTSAAWAELSKDGIDKAKLQDIFQGFSKAYGVEMDRVHGVTDPRVVRAMRDAVEFQRLKSKTVPSKKPSIAKVPAQRQNVPQQQQTNKRLDGRFRSGNAKVKDLAAFIMQNS